MFRGNLHHHHRGMAGHFGPRGRGKWGPFTVEWDINADGGPGRGRRRMFAGDELRLVLLKLIEEGPRHGYDLIREIEDRTGGAYAPSPGVVYPTLTMLADMGLIAEQASDDAKKVFAITTAGQAHLTEREEEVEALFERLAGIGAMRSRSHGSPVRRAMGNLRTVLQHRLGDGEVSQETLHAVAELIDEAARKIERL
ncbi:PadR family transcriptional regulator [Sphingomonas turrisvirgatae]|uniref:PadR family transcriptional regulator n=1 Tax=Sphingomonas turrisvirgatae TaxID=1888892 RepID=A0A1E3LX28_9SPHN|nr:PadR family transcriptional regulator [Sphingomonas turrisvirgatae]ODP38279.1 PadR family transcriptional regulator [Sphingomonas turrisvirgatae]